MQLIPTRIHGFLDYAMSLLLLASPWLFGFDLGGPEMWVPIAVGIAAILYSVATDYEAGAFRVISMRTHLRLDFLASSFLLTSPWLFAFSDFIQLPHVLMGVAGLAVMGLSRSYPEWESGRGDVPPGHAGHA